MTPLDDLLASRTRWLVLDGKWQAHDLPTVDHVITDPPYSQNTSNNARSAPDGSNGSTLGEARAFITFDGVDGQEAEIGQTMVRLAKRWVVIFCAMEQIGAYSAVLGNDYIRSGVWVRTNSAPQFTGDRPAQGCEGVVIAHRKGKKRWNGGGHVATWTGPTINAISDPDRGTLGHPTPKPLWIMLDMIEKFTDPGDLVLDPYCGAGTTGVACLRLGRRFLGCEESPVWAQTARDRLEAEEQQSTLTALRSGQLAMFGR